MLPMMHGIRPFQPKCSIYLRALITLLSLLITTPSYAIVINFSGAIEIINVDNGTSRFTSITVGEAFAGSIRYGDSADEASEITVEPPIFSDFLFDGPGFGGSLTSANTVVEATAVQVGPANNDGMGSDAAFINSLYGPDATTAATLADTWSASAFNSTSNELFGLVTYVLDLQLYSDLRFQVSPPSLSDADFALFSIEDYDDDGNRIYTATGRLTSLVQVPNPPVWMLLAIGLFGLTNSRSISTKTLTMFELYLTAVRSAKQRVLLG